MFERVAVPALSTVLSFLFFLAALVSPFVLFFTLGLAPCESEGFYGWTRFFVMGTLLGSAIWLARIKWKPRTRDFLIAVALPAASIGLNYIAAESNEVSQQRCAKRSLQEAIAFCRANPAVYRVGRDQYGYATMALVAPGTDDAAWQCLNNWHWHNGSVSMKIDDSVYEQYRRTHPKI